MLTLLSVLSNDNYQSMISVLCNDSYVHVSSLVYYVLYIMNRMITR